MADLRDSATECESETSIERHSDSPKTKAGADSVGLYAPYFGRGFPNYAPSAARGPRGKATAVTGGRGERWARRGFVTWSAPFARPTANGVLGAVL